MHRHTLYILKRKLAIFLYGGFEFKDVGDKLLHETDKEEE